VLGPHRLDEVFLPRARGIDDVALEGLHVNHGQRRSLGHPGDEVDLREGGFADPRREVDALGREGSAEQVFDAQPHTRVVAIARQEDDRRHEAAVGVAAQVELGAQPLLLVQNRLGHLDQLVSAGLEQLVAGIALQDLHQVLAGVAVAAEPDSVEHLPRPVAEDRDGKDGLRVCRGGQQSEEAVFAGHLALCVEGLDSDVVEVDRPVDGGPRVGLGEDEQFFVAGPSLRLWVESREPARRRTVVAQQPQA